ncbi:general secretion pathway protein GspL [Pseudomonas gingeri]|uniref:PilN domain-containing protein n=1 Tax=Pseudomonas gingeri TaxID=117681 RepID=UPI0015A1CB88|nr:PilN domain-containing protein [Pseudomonas gingeri]NWA25421.1 general secretion pathway protein GspL [Pseudomonas gingeri]
MKTLERPWRGPLQTTTTRLAQHWQASRLPVFLRWWLRELIACLPRRWREHLESSNQEHLLHWHEGALHHACGDVAPSASAPTRRQVLLMPCEQVLLSRVQLPLAASAQAHAALAFEMDKYTPFKAAQVYFDTLRVPQEDRTRPVFELTLVVALRERIDAILDEAARNGLRIDAIDTLDRNGTRLHVNLLPAQRRPQEWHPTRRLRLRLAWLGAGLLVAAMLMWVHNRQLALDAMNAEVAALRNDSQQIQGLRQQLNERLDTGRYVQTQKTQALSRTALLQELTACIPVDTWLEQLDIDAQGTLTLSAQSSQAGDLIGKMKACTHLRNLQFQGVIQADASTGQDRLNLTAHLDTRE